MCLLHWGSGSRPHKIAGNRIALFVRFQPLRLADPHARQLESSVDAWSGQCPGHAPGQGVFDAQKCRQLSF